MQFLSKKQLLFISFMLFSMFFGAGNLIFPAFLGRASGIDTYISMAGFILSAVGLPILGVIAVAKLGSLDTLGRRVSPLFALLFPFIIYISIGPLMAIPRAATVSFEMGLKPFLAEGADVQWPLVFYSVIFFCLVLWFSLSPNKLIDLFGKILTPSLLVLLAIILIKSIVTPLGGTAATAAAYQENTFFKGFLDGYMTMDLLGSLVFGIVIANTIYAQGITDKRSLSLSMMTAGLGAGILLAAIYVILGYIGATSGLAFGHADNGATVLSQVMKQLFGQAGTIILAVIFTIACLCVSIGLIISCSEYFSALYKKWSYKQWAFILTLISGVVANLGLNSILSFSVPVLGLIYPIAVVLILLALADTFIRGSKWAYSLTISMTALYSILDTLNNTLFKGTFDAVLRHIPLYEQQVGWVLPAIIGLVIGLVVDRPRKK
ncbi:branched-chain amino acid transport system II carrier protein [Bacillus testis]|uniref:branched-chain amino acid transport system II carrier protein n=1 Tax=Bacillus testis TaxID=1622072 RepID=UPI00067F71BA|nr:branched-chain amino acid transport system II carrier protein [Bacillus testis]